MSSSLVFGSDGMAKGSKAYWILKSHIRFWTEKVYYDGTFVEGVENIPSDGTPVMIVSNHQNSMNDALGILLAINDRKPNFIVRADVFGISAFFGKFLRSIGLLPAYRLNYEGSAALSANTATFRTSEEALINGETVVIFPEGGHAEGHWLNIFKGGMAKMAFEAAEIAGFEKDIKIVPACNHYSSYHGLRGRQLVRFAEPISLSKYYDLYRDKPRTAARELATEVREIIESMMLDVKDKEFYNELEFIRGGQTGDEFASGRGIEEADFSGRLESDKVLVSRFFEARKAENPYFRVVSSEEGQTLSELAAIQEREQRETAAGEAGENSPSPVEKLLLDTRELLRLYSANGLEDRQFRDKPSIFGLVLQIAALLVLLPLALIFLWPSAICWFVPLHFAKKAKGDMFEGTFVLAMNVLVIIPLASIVTFIAVSLKFTVLFAVICVLVLPLVLLFEWNYFRTLRAALTDIRFFRTSGNVRKRIAEFRASLFAGLTEFLKN